MHVDMETRTLYSIALSLTDRSISKWSKILKFGKEEKKYDFFK